jgi:hypothetical protein
MVPLKRATELREITFSRVVRATTVIRASVSPSARGSSSLTPTSSSGNTARDDTRPGTLVDGTSSGSVAGFVRSSPFAPMS